MDPTIKYSIALVSLTTYSWLMTLLWSKKASRLRGEPIRLVENLTETRRLKERLSEAWAINDQLTDAARLARSMAFQEAAHIIQEQIDSLGGGMPYPYSSMERDQVGPHLEGLLDEILDLGKPPTKAAQDQVFPYRNDFSKPYPPAKGRTAYEGRTLYEQARIYLAAMGIESHAAHDAANDHIAQYGNEPLTPECLDVVVGIMMRHRQS